MNNIDTSPVLDRFLQYVAVDTQSDESSTTSPSTEKQKNLGRLLTQQLVEMGASDVYFDEEYCYVYAKIPSTLTDKSSPASQTVLGFLSHMDTSPDSPGKDVKPRIINDYDGGVIMQNEKLGLTMSPETFPSLLSYVGKTLVVTDGTTLLGADDKAGVAEIMTMAAFLLAHPELPHPTIAIAFTPDEEIGAGVDHIDLSKLGATVAYTVDGGGLGELEYENFNAAAVHIKIHGRIVHPGEAKDKMVNALSIAMELDRMLPEQQKPEYTEGYEGFFHLHNMEGDVETTQMHYLIRDHYRDRFETKKKLLADAADYLKQKYGEGTVEAIITDSYYNMKEVIDPDYMYLISRAEDKMQSLGIEPKVLPIRGGTDGARLSFMGLPCPNICTGGHNFHGKQEYVCVESMEAIARLLILLALQD